jgi:lipopolysaccharide export system ATP-binding protein
MSLVVKNLEKTYAQRKVVKGVSFNVSPGEILGLLGPNGAGKTTIFYMTVGLVRADKGRVFMEETDITNLAMFKRARTGIGYLPQEPSIFRPLRPEETWLCLTQVVLSCS